jgi:sugar/nucleoside kinase (ribokinase family)
MQIRAGKTSPVAYCWTDAPTGKRSVAWTSGDLVEVTPDEVDYELLAASRVLHLDGHHTQAALAAAKFAKANGILVNMEAGTLRDGVPELLAFTDILIASEEFARKITGCDDLDQAIFKLADYGAKVTGITMGELGSMVLTPEKTILRCPAFKLDKVVDTTGAGDVYHTGFCIRYLETDDLRECMRFGSAVSALKCGKLGGRTGIPTRAEVDKFLQDNK